MWVACRSRTRFKLGRQDNAAPRSTPSHHQGTRRALGFATATLTLRNNFRSDNAIRNSINSSLTNSCYAPFQLRVAPVRMSALQTSLYRESKRCLSIQLSLSLSFSLLSREVPSTLSSGPPKDPIATTRSASHAYITYHKSANEPPLCQQSTVMSLFVPDLYGMATKQ